MTERDRQALLRVRSQARLVRELSERLEDAEAAAIPVRQMDGMPRGKGGMPRGLEMKLMLKESLEKSVCSLRYPPEARAASSPAPAGQGGLHGPCVLPQAVKLCISKYNIFPPRAQVKTAPEPVYFPGGWSY